MALEFLSVVFAVLLALGLNSYKQSLDKTEEAFFANIGKQISEQENTIPYNTALSLYFNISILNSAAEGLEDAYTLLLKPEDEK